jgi:hypothetical protein
MKQYYFKECETLQEVKKATKGLSKAKLVNLQFDDGGVTKDVDNFKGVYNYTKGKYASTVVNYYNLVQHKDYFDSFAIALDRLNIKYKMTIQEVNNRAFCDIDFKDRNVKYDKLNEEFTTGIRLINSYDKSSGIAVMPRFTRLACMNGMIVTRTEKTMTIKHIDKMAKEIEKFVEKKLHGMINEYSDLQRWVSNSMKDSIEWKKGCLIIAKLFDQLKHREEILKRLGISIVSVADKKDKKKKLNRWDMYNAITHYLTHGEQITPHIETIFQKKATALLTSKLIKMPLAEVQ